ncbi:hypothetical protein CO710_13340, partial [Acetobacter orleanensis]
QTHLAGWAVQDNPECRWTTGQAVLDLGHRNAETIAMLSLQILNGGPYLMEEAPQAETIATH